MIPENQRPTQSREATKKFNFSFGLPLSLCVFVLVVCFSFFPKCLLAEEGKLVFLPNDLAFKPLVGDPREPHDSIILSSGQNPYEGAIGSFIEFLQWRPGDASKWSWGILGAGYIGLGSVHDINTYPKRVVDDNGFLVFNKFPERVSDWYLGTYFAQSAGAFSNRFEYTHVSSHLGDELFDYVQRIIYTRESFKLTSSFQPSPQFRFYAGAGTSPHIAPQEPPFFLHGGTELYTNYFGFIAHTAARGYMTYDLKIKDEAGGVVDHAFQWGLEWREREESGHSLRFAILYDNGNSEYGQFYQQKDEHWGFGFYFDP